MGNPHYETLTAPERVALTLEAMARGDERQADLLGDTCPQHVYRCDDLDFRGRMRHAYMVTAMVALNMRAGLTRIRMASAFQKTAHLFAGEIGRFATAAYLCGRINGRHEAGLASAGPDDPDVVAVELLAAGGFDDERAEIRDVAEEVVRKLADALHAAVGEADAVDLLSQWEGFGRFCRDALGLEAVTVDAAFGLGRDDVASELATAFPDAKPDAAEAARWAAEWARGWARRFGHPPR